MSIGAGACAEQPLTTFLVPSLAEPSQEIAGVSCGPDAHHAPARSGCILRRRSGLPPPSELQRYAGSTYSC
jgi:hypothetical protein